jgi:hypothetical protein
MALLLWLRAYAFPRNGDRLGFSLSLGVARLKEAVRYVRARPPGNAFDTPRALTSGHCDGF